MSARFDTYEKYRPNATVSDPPCIIHAKQRRTSVDGRGTVNWHYELELQLCTSGSGYIILNGKRHEIAKGTVVAVNSDCTHYTGSDTEIEFYPLIISSDFCRKADIDPTAIKYTEFINDPEITRLFESLIEIYYSEASPYKKASLQAATLLLLAELTRRFTVSKKEYTDSDLCIKQVQNAIVYIRENYRKKLSLEEIAAHTLTDKYRLSHIFKAYTGLTVVSYINEYRCSAAAELLGNSATVSEAAEECGFSSPSFFTKIFKSCKGGLLPSDFKSTSRKA